MVKENESKEKLCLFFASDYHFEMISLPYINENLKLNKNVIVITENDLNKTVNELLSKINLKSEDKEKLTKIDWDSNDLNKFKEIKKANEDGKETIIFVKGRENYIESINKNIDNWINVEDTKVINCYDVNEVQDSVSNIAKRYGKILSTSGIEKLL
ncbi:MAG: hypothetical protein IJE05_04100 [Clostridia bacterium]|nr:hypothetical protein [Clostridia bacterium]